MSEYSHTGKFIKKEGWLTCDGEWFFTSSLTESGVTWIFITSIATGRLDGAVATLEGTIKMASRNGKGRAQLSLAEQLLARKKETAGRVTEAFDEDFANLTPNVHELLTRRLVDDKKQIDPATVLIFARSGSWHACLSHKGLALKWWGEAGTIQGALASLERACGKECGSEEGSLPRNATDEGGSPP